MKTVFVTGGTRGIGRGLVDKFSSEGYRVVFTYNTNRDIAESMMSKYVLPFQCSNTDFDCIKNIKKNLDNKKICIDVLVNNAGIVRDKTFKNMSYDEWETVIDTNLNAVYLTTKIFLDDMLKNKWGRIINLSSIIGQKGGYGQTNYSASKAGIIGFTKSLALEVASKGITVNAISPGFIDTDMCKGIPQDRLNQIVDSIPMKRMGSVSDIAELVFFLNTNKAQYITGQVIGINGGLF